MQGPSKGTTTLFFIHLGETEDLKLTGTWADAFYALGYTNDKATTEVDLTRGLIYKLVVGPFETGEEAEKVRAALLTTCPNAKVVAR